MNNDFKEIWGRALWTFAECFLASLPFTAEIIQGLYAIAISGLISALAMALSAIKTIIMQCWRDI